MSQYPSLKEGLLSDFAQIKQAQVAGLEQVLDHVLEPGGEDPVQTDCHIPGLIKSGQSAVNSSYWHKINDLVSSAKTLAVSNDASLSEKIIQEFKLTNEKQKKTIQEFSGQRLFCVSGGPGTGKTTIAAACLAKIDQLSSQDTRSIVLAAPTGRAAGRLMESLSDSFKKHNLTMPQVEAKTIHRLLKYSPRSNRFSYNKENQLESKLIILDEASMLSPYLLASVIDASNSDCSLLLLGDPDQLPPVNSDIVFEKVCEQVDPACGVQLVENFRAKEAGNLVAILKEINKSELDPGNPLVGIELEAIKKEQSVTYLQNEEEVGVKCLQVTQQSEIKDFLEQLKTEILKPFFQDSLPAIWTECSKTGQYQPFWEAALKYQLLTIYNGKKDSRSLLSANGINHYLETELAACPLLPRMQTINDYRLKLYNGDVGLLVKKEDSVNFPAIDQNENGFHAVQASLPGLVSSFAITVHKSQGSQYETVIMILPTQDSNENEDEGKIFTNPSMLKKLLYTGLSRARKKVLLISMGQGDQVF